ncbi:MAG: MFS transporter [Ruminiclostridium sp.]|nr:MFS transporter [Ruminiclostridium sp.]
MNIQRQLQKFYAFGLFSCLRIPDAVWVVLLTARGFPLWQVGLAEGVFHLVSLLAEIPSGMAADLMGRRRSLAAAGLCGLISALLMAFSATFFGVCLSMAFSALACSLISGSDEALLYDSLLQAGRQEDYIPVNARYAQVQNLGSILSNAASLLAGVLSYVGFYLLDAAVCLVRALTAWSLTEPVVTKTQASRQEHPFRDLGNRFRVHVTQAASFLRASPRSALLMGAGALVDLPGFLTLMFLQQTLNDRGLSPMWLGLPIMAISLARMAGAALGRRVRPKGLRPLFALSALTVGLGTMTAGGAPMVPAVLGAMTAAGAMEVWRLHLQNRLNGLFPSDQRATLVSVDAMAYSLLMIPASPLVGWLGDIGPTAGTGLMVLGLLVAAAGLAALRIKSR